MTDPEGLVPLGSIDEYTDIEMKEYRDRVRNCKDIDKIVNDIESLIVPSTKQCSSMEGIIAHGSKLFGIAINTASHEDVMVRYANLVRVVTVVMYKLHEDGRGSKVDEFRVTARINKILETLYYVHQTMISAVCMNKISNPLYDSNLNSDISLTKFVPISPKNLTPYQIMLLFLSNRIGMFNWRREGDDCMKTIYTTEGHNTRAWRRVKSITEFVHDETETNGCNISQWKNATSHPSNVSAAIKALTSAKDANFCDVVKDRRLFSFNNGIFESWRENAETGRIECVWYPYSSLTDSDSNDTTLAEERFSDGRSACRYFDKDFPEAATSAAACEENWRDVETPYFEKIMDCQNFSEDVKRWMYILCGRLLHPVGTDDWQIMPFLKGKAKSGKSTIIGQVCAKFFDTVDVGVLSNNIEKKFGLSSLANKFMFIAPEIKSDIGLEQCEFQTIISGEATSVAEKFKTAKVVDWSAPGIMAGNEAPSYKNNQGSIGRRLIVFEFGVSVENGDPMLAGKLSRELPSILKKCAMAYVEAFNDFGSLDIWTVLPEFFKETRLEMSKETNLLVQYLKSDNVKTGSEERCRIKELSAAFKDYTAEMSYPAIRWTVAYYTQAVSDCGLKLIKSKKMKDPKDGNMYSGMWVEGCSIVESDVLDDGM